MVNNDVADEAQCDDRHNIKPAQAHPEGQNKQSSEHKVELIGRNP